MKRRLAVRLLGSIPGALGLLVRQKVYPRLFGSCGRKVVFGRNLSFINASQVHLGNGVVLSDYVTLGVERAGGSITIGDGAFLGVATSICTQDGTVRIEEGANLGSGCTVHPRSNTRIGKHTLLAAFCDIGSHDEEGAGPIDIGEGCWLGVRVAVSGGTSLGRDAIVGAHACVQHDLPERSISVGTPAEVVRMREAG